jgi:hypothetical protein
MCFFSLLRQNVMSKQVKGKEVEIKNANFRLQKGHKQNFVFYDAKKSQQLKRGYPFWELQDDGSLNFRATPENDTRTQQILWMENGFADKLAEGKIWVVTGAPVIESKSLKCPACGSSHVFKVDELAIKCYGCNFYGPINKKSK